MSTEPVVLRWPEFLKLLAHDIRWGILTLLARSDYRGQDLVKKLRHPQNLISYHLRHLADHHLVTERRSSADARDIYYSLNVEALRSHYTEAGSALHPALGTLSHTKEEKDEPHSVPYARILFLCTKNSARSQIAEALLRHFSQGSVDVESAGTEPAELHPDAIEVMTRMGIDIGRQHSKHLDQFHTQSFDYVITVCDRVREVCPTFAEEGETMHWSIPDPARDDLPEQERHALFEEVTHELVRRVRTLLFLIEQQGQHESSES